MIMLVASKPLDGCPERHTLLDFSRGRLAEPVLDVIGNHLTACHSCVVILSEIQQREADEGLDARLRPFLAGSFSQAQDAKPDHVKDCPISACQGSLAEDQKTRGKHLVGTKVGRYRLLEVIGAGGMGVVYRAEQVLVGQIVALKTITDSVLARPDRLARFRTEGAALARLCHPNVVQLYHFDEDDGRPYFTMELVDGINLAWRLAEGPLDFRNAASLIRTLAHAVGYAHGEGVIHRDLKPANVLLTLDGVPKVTDFGLAKVLDEGIGRFTDTDAVMGTPSYMAPEQAAGRTAEVGPRTDVYALGAILYEAITGVPPFTSDSRIRILALAREGNVVAPSRHRTNVPADLEAVCLKCLALSPRDRFPSAEALAEELDRWLNGQRTITRLPGPVRRLAAAVRRQARAAGVGLLAIACGLLGVVALYPRSPAGGTGSAEEVAAALKNLDAKLVAAKPGQEVELFGTPGARAYYRVRYGDERTKVSVAADGTLTVSSWTECLVELTPDPRHDSYQFGASVCHQTSDLGGEVGLYFSHHTCPSPSGQENHWFGQMTYNDVRRPEGVAAAASPQAKGKLQAPSESRVRIGFRTRGDQEPRGGEELWSGAPFAPRGIAADTWRDLAVVVTPAGVEGTLDGREVGLVSADKLGKAVLGLRDHMAARRPHPVWNGCNPGYTSRGGLGLLVYRGTASFRTVNLMIRERNP